MGEVQSSGEEIGCLQPTQDAWRVPLHRSMHSEHHSEGARLYASGAEGTSAIQCQLGELIELLKSAFLRASLTSRWKKKFRKKRRKTVKS